MTDNSMPNISLATRQQMSIVALLAMFFFTACATVEDASHSPAQSEPQEAATDIEYPVRDFPVDTLYDILLAEFAGIRNDVPTAIDIYIDQARKTRDPAIIDRAVRIASFLNHQDVVLELAQLWVEIEPDNLNVRRLAAFQLARAGHVIEAFPHGEYLLLAGDNDYLQSLAAFAKDASQDEKERLLALYEELSATHGDNPGLLLGKAMLLRQLDRNDASLAVARTVIKLEPDNETGQLLYAQLLFQQGQEKSGLKALENALKKSPDSKRLRLQYARFLSERDLAQSRQQMIILAEQYPDDLDLQFSLGLVNIELGLDNQALDIFTTLINHRYRIEDAHYQLGRLAEKHEDLTTAIDHYRNVVRGDSMIPAVLRLTEILVKQNNIDSARDFLVSLRALHPELATSLYQVEVEMLHGQGKTHEALTLLSQALEKSPGNINLLYARSIITSEQKNLAAAESDLRDILKQDPNSATILNALGYTLLLLSDRYQEAKELITRAITLEPDNPAIIDSMGWVHYRLGNLEKAEHYLLRAYKAYPDPEVAAHLGEVLWVQGKKDEARALWRETLKNFPDNPLILDAIERLTGKKPLPNLQAPDNTQ